MTTSSPTRTSPSDHDPWRVILVGRTGLDQLLRRDAQIELIRCRDTIEAVGELGDPIDHESPSQAVVIVSADEISDDARERKSFINALRLVEPSVCVLRVGEEAEEFDGVLGRDETLPELVSSIGAFLKAHNHEPVSLKYIDPSASDEADEDDSEQVAASEPEAVADEEVVETEVKADVASAFEEINPDAVEPEPEPASESKAVQPEVKVVIDADTFEHRAQRTFEDEDAIHRRIVLGATDDSMSPPAQPHAHQQVVLDDQSLVQDMLRGRGVLDSAVELINRRLGRSDITFVSADAPGAAIGVPVIVGNKVTGVLNTADTRWLNGQGRSLLATHATWLATWIKLEIQQGELRRCAFTDSLTGAWNRRYFERFLSAAMEQSRIARRPLTVMLFDIDSFKHYNDTYGHGAGDEILVETVKLLKSVIRPSDRVCRVGGDEFAVIFYEPDGPRDPSSKPLESIYEIACRFQKQVCQHRFPKLGEEALGTLTISGGLASYPWDGHDAASLLEEADRYAMESKRQGKNAITLGPGAESVCHTEL